MGGQGVRCNTSLVTCQTLWMLRCNMFSGRKKKPLPIYFLTHLRWAGCVELGEGGRLLLCQLDHILLQPGSCPATESLRDVRKTGFLRQLKRPCTVYGDGAKSWKSECKRHRLCFRDVTHYKMEFTRKTKVKQKVRISGTQLLDQVWRHLKRFVPFSVHSKDKVTRKDSQRIQQYISVFLRLSLEQQGGLERKPRQHVRKGQQTQTLNP